jgi:hypothetical protein
MFVEDPLLAAFRPGDSVEVFAIEHQSCGSKFPGMCLSYLRHQFFPTAWGATPYSSWAQAQ